jgi:hypothetical protein
VKVADTHGIVYTPQEIVDFMCASVEEALQTEFGLTLGSKGVNGQYVRRSLSATTSPSRVRPLIWKRRNIERPQFTKTSRSNRPDGIGTSHNRFPERFVPSMLSTTKTPRALHFAIASKSDGRSKSCAP